MRLHLSLHLLVERLLRVIVLPVEFMNEIVSFPAQVVLMEESASSTSTLFSPSVFSY